MSCAAPRDGARAKRRELLQDLLLARLQLCVLLRLLLLARLQLRDLLRLLLLARLQLLHALLQLLHALLQQLLALLQLLHELSEGARRSTKRSHRALGQPVVRRGHGIAGRGKRETEFA